MFDIVIIGAGVTGCACAEALSRYRANICVLEKEEDVCAATSKANSGIVHAGFDAATGSVMAKMNVRGNALMGELAQALDFPFVRNGSLVVCLDESDLPALEALRDKGIANGVEGLCILNKEELRAREANISPDAVAALYAPSGGIVCPFGLTIALAEHAAMNGVAFRFDTEATAIAKSETGWRIETSGGTIDTKTIINAAGVYADVFHNMVSDAPLHITPRRGEYCLLDKTAGAHVSHTIFQLPTPRGKGVLVTPTVHGNLLIGPTAEDIDAREDTATTAEGLRAVLSKAGATVRDLPLRDVITNFAGLRAHEDGHEFHLGAVGGASGFFDCAGIESPGLTSAPAIGEHLCALLVAHLHLAAKGDFIATRKGVLDPKTLNRADYAALIAKQPAYGNLICRCEGISEGEILDAIHRPLGARSLDGIKRRTRAQMGRCQGGFCSPRLVEILAKALACPETEITKSGKASPLLYGHAKPQCDQ